MSSLLASARGSWRWAVGRVGGNVICSTPLLPTAIPPFSPGAALRGFSLRSPSSHPRMLVSRHSTLHKSLQERGPFPLTHTLSPVITSPHVLPISRGCARPQRTRLRLCFLGESRSPNSRFCTLQVLVQSPLGSLPGRPVGGLEACPAENPHDVHSWWALKQSLEAVASSPLKHTCVAM